MIGKGPQFNPGQDPEEFHGVRLEVIAPAIIGGAFSFAFQCACGWTSSSWPADGQPIGEEAENELVSHLLEVSPNVLEDQLRELLPVLYVMAGRIVALEGQLTAALAKLRQQGGAGRGGVIQS